MQIFIVESDSDNLAFVDYAYRGAIAEILDPDTIAGPLSEKCIRNNILAAHFAIMAPEDYR